jgi:hypothetical protein
MFCYQDKIVKHYVHELLLNLSQNMLMFKRESKNEFDRSNNVVDKCLSNCIVSRSHFKTRCFE